MINMNSHANTAKKSYRKPVLNKIGNVKTLTKGAKPGSTDANNVSSQV
ncbi:hypothetical protein CLV98_101505 [Dyadobacter jejuensis]|uniref:Lasso RiPP family leader peptide-containing protein n=1 Tax=Dyadobacter jejuensis TaxID=1082580 RepID=A0A316AST0_9BACT|nr:hypothetical protein CLV98_101505 [Dyadobacter jejuensis]